MTLREKVQIPAPEREKNLMNTALYLTRILAISLIVGGVIIIANQLVDYSNTQTEQIALVGTSVSSKFNY